MNKLPPLPKRYFSDQNRPYEEKLIIAIALFFLLLALPSNKWLVSSLFSPDGTIESSWFGALILVMQSSLIALSAGLIYFRTKTLTKYITFLLMGLFLAFCSSLLFDRALILANYSTQQLPQLAHFPNTRDIFKNIEFIYQLDTNSQGIRDDEIPLEKPASSYRVVVIGDSLTEGVGVEGYQTFSSVAQELFASKRPDKTIEFINCGFSNTGSLEQARILTYLCMEYEPDAVLVALHANDVTETPPSAQGSDIDLIDSKTGVKGVLYGLWPRLSTILLKDSTDIHTTYQNAQYIAPPPSATLDIIAAVSQEARQRGMTEEQIAAWQESLPPELVQAANGGKFNRDILAAGLLKSSYWTDSLDITSQEAQAKYMAMISLLNETIGRLHDVNIPVGVVLMPTPFQYAPNYGELWKRVGVQTQQDWAVAPTELEKRLETWSQEQHVPYLDLTPIYRELAKESPEMTLHYRLDGHWTWQGHEVAANEIVKWLRAGALSEVTVKENEEPTKMLIKPDPIALAQQFASAQQSTTVPELVVQQAAGAENHPTLADLWEGKAEFVIEVHETGLPMGESDTIVMSNGDLWSYLHASNRSAGTMDQCGAPVAFPGCTVIYRSFDGGYSFKRDETPVCQFECRQCPCDSKVDHIDQQQYPRVFYDDERLNVVYEYQGRSMRRQSLDGLNWNQPEGLGKTGLWKLWYDSCPAYQLINEHPFAPINYECISGGPPGIYIDNDRLYLFVAMGQNPGGMGCFVASSNSTGDKFQPCQNNPLIKGASDYGPLEQRGAESNAFFDFRTISSAEIQKISKCQDARYYMLYEGIRGPGPGDAGDSQFGLGLARTLNNQIDGAWEKYPNNPLLVDLPGNIGLGHADLVVYKGKTLLYTSLDGVHRSRMGLVWNENYKQERANGLVEEDSSLTNCSMRYEFEELMTQQRPQIGLAFLNLLGGWLMALLFVPLSISFMSSLQLEERLGRRVGSQLSLTNRPLLRKTLFVLILLFALSRSLDLLNLTNLVEPLQTLLYQLPSLVLNLIGAVLLFVIAWLLARQVKDILSQQKAFIPRADLVGKVISWLILLALLPGILDLLLERWLTIQPSVIALIALLANLLSAAIILAAGYFIAQLLYKQDAISNRLTSFYFKSLMQTKNEPNSQQNEESTTNTRMKAWQDAQEVTKLTQQLFFVLIQIPFVIMGLSLLYLEEFNQPTLLIFVVATLIALLVHRIMNKRLPALCFKYLNQQQPNKSIPMDQPLETDRIGNSQKAQQLAKRLSNISFALIITAPLLILLVQFPLEMGSRSGILNKLWQSLPSLLVITLLFLISYLIARQFIKLLKYIERQGFFDKLKWNVLMRRGRVL